MKINKYQQRGMGGVEIAAVLFLFILALAIFFKLFPLYMDNMAVGNALEKLMEEPKLAQKKTSDIQRMFAGHLADKNVQPFGDTPIKEIVTVIRNSDVAKVEITVKYSREAKFQGNLFFLVKFEHIVETP